MLPSHPCQAGTTVSLPSLSSLSTVSNSFNCEEVNSKGCANRLGGHHIRDVSTATTPTSCHSPSVPRGVPSARTREGQVGAAAPPVQCVYLLGAYCVLLWAQRLQCFVFFFFQVRIDRSWQCHLSRGWMRPTGPRSVDTGCQVLGMGEKPVR